MPFQALPPSPPAIIEQQRPDEAATIQRVLVPDLIAGPVQFVTSELGRNLSYFPDPRLFRAAMLLQPDERPTVPVRLLPRSGFNTASSDAAGAYARAIKTIYVNKDTGDDFRQPARLASILAHEAVHASRPDDWERPAYEKQIEVARRLAADNAYQWALRERLKKYGKRGDPTLGTK